ncbi:hypothetical protein [Stenomitos frigidus]|nr:hypothetical protein [Stenomitos frigidus]
MSNSLALKNLPTPVRSLLRPMLFAAIGLHALLLFTPIPSEEKPKKTDDKENPVKITQLPTAKPAAKARPKLAKPALPKINRPKPVVAVPKSPSTPRAKGAGGATDDTKNPFVDFPHYPGSVPNYQGLENLRVASGASLVSVVAHFRKALPAQKFTLTDEPEPNTFKVSKGGISYFLSVIEDGSQTFYLLGPDKLDKAKLAAIKEGKVVGIPPELGGIAKALDTTYAISQDNSATSLDVSQSSSFFEPDKDNPSNEVYVDGISETRIIDGQPPAQVYQALQATVLKGFESVTEAGTYGGGPLYELKKGKFTGGLSLVPGKTGGTVAVIWTKKP